MSARNDEVQLEVLRSLHQQAGWEAEPKFAEIEAKGRQPLGIELLLDLIDKDKLFIVVEIGSEFGGSTRRFLAHSPEVWVVSIDPWPANYPAPWDSLKPHLAEDGSMEALFRSFCWEYRDRLIPRRGVSPRGLVELYETGLRPDLIYVDGLHTYDGVYEDLTVCQALFPDSRIGGDDWDFEGIAFKYEGMKFPVRYAVKQFAVHHQHDIVHHENTWLINPQAGVTFEPPPKRFLSDALQYPFVLASYLLRRRFSKLKKSFTRRSK